MNQKIKNAIYGLAIGDATAYNYEFLSADQTKKILEESNYDWLNPNIDKILEVSDDTQMSIYLLEAFFNWKESNEPYNRFIQHAAERFVTWYQDPRNNRAPGNACINATYALSKLAGGYPKNMLTLIKNDGALDRWGKRYTPNSMGSGTVMRSPWLGLLHAEGIISSGELTYFNEKHSILTHGHDAANHSANLASIITSKLLTDGYQGKNWIFNIVEDFISHTPNKELEDMLLKLKAIPNEWFTMKDHKNTDINEYFPSQWTSPYVLGSAIAILIATVGNPVAMMQRCMINNQDSDTIGAVAGAFVGVCSDDPDFWHGIEQKLELDYLEELDTLIARFENLLNA